MDSFSTRVAVPRNDDTTVAAVIAEVDRLIGDYGYLKSPLDELRNTVLKLNQSFTSEVAQWKEAYGEAFERGIEKSKECRNMRRSVALLEEMIRDLNKYIQDHGAEDSSERILSLKECIREQDQHIDRLNMQIQQHRSAPSHTDAEYAAKIKEKEDVIASQEVEGRHWHQLAVGAEAQVQELKMSLKEHKDAILVAYEDNDKLEIELKKQEEAIRAHAQATENMAKQIHDLKDAMVDRKKLIDNMEARHKKAKEDVAEIIHNVKNENGQLKDTIDGLSEKNQDHIKRQENLIEDYVRKEEDWKTINRDNEQTIIAYKQQLELVNATAVAHEKKVQDNERTIQQQVHMVESQKQVIVNYETYLTQKNTQIDEQELRIEEQLNEVERMAETIWSLRHSISNKNDEIQKVADEHDDENEHHIERERGLQNEIERLKDEVDHLRSSENRAPFRGVGLLQSMLTTPESNVRPSRGYFTDRSTSSKSNTRPRGSFTARRSRHHTRKVATRKSTEPGVYGIKGHASKEPSSPAPKQNDPRGSTPTPISWNDLTRPVDQFSSMLNKTRLPGVEFAAGISSPVDPFHRSDTDATVYPQAVHAQDAPPASNNELPVDRFGTNLPSISSMSPNPNLPTPGYIDTGKSFTNAADYFKLEREPRTTNTGTESSGSKHARAEYVNEDYIPGEPPAKQARSSYEENDSIDKNHHPNGPAPTPSPNHSAQMVEDSQAEDDSEDSGDVTSARGGPTEGSEDYDHVSLYSESSGPESLAGHQLSYDFWERACYSVSENAESQVEDLPGHKSDSKTSESANMDDIAAGFLPDPEQMEDIGVEDLFGYEAESESKWNAMESAIEDGIEGGTWASTLFTEKRSGGGIDETSDSQPNDPPAPESEAEVSRSNDHGEETFHRMNVVAAYRATQAELEDLPDNKSEIADSEAGSVSLLFGNRP